MGKLIRSLAAALTSVTLLSGCISGSGGSGGAVSGEIKAAAEKGDIEGLKSIADRLLSEETPSKSNICVAAGCCAGLGDYTAAAEYYGRCLDIDPQYEEAVEGYITALWSGGMLDNIAESFPADDEIVFRGRPLSGYDSRELIEMTSKPNQISYRTPEYIYDSFKLYDGGGTEITLPYGIERGMDNTRMYEALGFTEEQAARISGIRNLSLEITDEGLTVKAKKSRYAAFSQHPYEDFEFILKKGRVELKFNIDAEIMRYSIGVLI